MQKSIPINQTTTIPVASKAIIQANAAAWLKMKKQKEFEQKFYTIGERIHTQWQTRVELTYVHKV